MPATELMLLTSITSFSKRLCWLNWPLWKLLCRTLERWEMWYEKALRQTGPTSPDCTFWPHYWLDHYWPVCFSVEGNQGIMSLRRKKGLNYGVLLIYQNEGAQPDNRLLFLDAHGTWIYLGIKRRSFPEWIKLSFFLRSRGGYMDFCPKKDQMS